jgi:Tfp pilus assembly protein PilZ
MDNQRRFPRAPLTGTVKFYDWDKPMQADATEISGEGIFLKTPQALPEGALLTLRLCIPGLDEAFTVLGKVVRTVRGGLLRPAGMGVRFVDIPARARDRISEYVARRTLRVA